MTRRPDPRIGAQIAAALGGCRSVINVGAGAGAYEPAQTVLAVEPSLVMIGQRPAGSAPAVQARAEMIPVADDAADAVMAVLTGARIEPVPIPHDCFDGFTAAYWRRPRAYLDPAVRAGISMLAQLDDDILRPGLRRLAADLDSGRWHARHRELLLRGNLDAGYQLLIADQQPNAHWPKEAGQQQKDHES